MSYNCFAAYYDTLTENVDYKVRSDYISNFFIRYGVKQGIILDLACGTGKIGISLAQKGYDIIGVDSSPEMLCEAQCNASAAGQDILFLCQKMQELDLYGTIKGCVCSLDSINHLTTPGDAFAAFEKVALFMEKGGLFIFDVNTVYKHREILGNNTFIYDEDNVYVVWQNAYNTQDESVEITLDFFEREHECYYRETECITERAYELDVLTDLLIKAGFEVLHIYDELTQNAPNPNSERVYFIARK